MYILKNGNTLLVYKEYLDGPLLSEEEAKEKYPEEFV